MKPKRVFRAGPVLEIEQYPDLFEVFVLRWRGCWRVYFQNAPDWWFLYLGPLFLFWDRHQKKMSVEWNPD